MQCGVVMVAIDDDRRCWYHSVMDMMYLLLALIASLLVVAVTEGQYVGGSDIDDMAGGFVI